MTSLKTSLRNTGWRRHTFKINLSKSDISPEWLYRSRSRFLKKLMVSVGVSWSGETCVFFIDPQKTKVDQNYVTLICWRLPYCLNVVDFIPAMTLNFCKTVLRHIAQKWCASVSSHHHCAIQIVIMQQFLWQNTPDFIAADEWPSYSPDLNPLDYCIWDISRIWCTKADDFHSQIYRTARRQSKTYGRRSPLRQLENPLTIEKQEVKVIWQKAPHGGPIPRLGVTPGGRKLYYWIPGVGFPISVP